MNFKFIASLKLLRIVPLKWNLFSQRFQSLSCFNFCQTIISQVFCQNLTHFISFGLMNIQNSENLYWERPSILPQLSVFLLPPIPILLHLCRVSVYRISREIVLCVKKIEFPTESCLCPQSPLPNLTGRPHPDPRPEPELSWPPPVGAAIGGCSDHVTMTKGIHLEDDSAERRSIGSGSH